MDRFTIAQLFGAWYVRKDGQLALGPVDKMRAQDHADRMNAQRADNKEASK
jgi:hypothetical protein